MVLLTFFSFVMRRQRVRYYSIGSAAALLLLCVVFISCSGPSLGSNSTTPATATATPAISAPSQVALATLHWCGKPLMIFRDEGARAVPTAAGTTPTPAGTVTATSTTSAPKTITNWSEVEANLGFTTYLPTTLPQGTCLVSTSGTVHDPILGGSFIITYLLPDHSPISLSEAPARSQNTQFQCNPSIGTTPQATPKAGTPTATQTPTQVCTGTHTNTSIVFSARGSTADLQQFFSALQPQVNWVPSQ